LICSSKHQIEQLNKPENTL